ncbi:family 16 glycosylhydrolase [Streptomyces sp. TLI_171]|uniref:glycoside hydrolase family 16 protein n=1 Tax=Streptomyces sp. TLI_171 TaxID=1938859 RepID=UPI000C19F542|nr:glycoside hydrolase family 16 protein [Streptomyces sp. TLI_171]RKE22622.1 glycosyl hydrolase family 16 [Streptomyces sp. TLI_171]
MSPQTLARAGLTPARLLLAASGWAAVLVTALQPGNPVRAAVVAAFLLAGPGTAAVRLARVMPGRPTTLPERIGHAGLVVGTSLALATLTGEALLLTDSFTSVRALVVLAALTTAGALAPARPWRPTARHLAPLAAVLALLLLAGCSGLGKGDPAAGRDGQVAEAAGTAPGAGDTTGPAAPGPWRSVLHEDFSGTRLDHGAWATCYDWNVNGCTNGGNHEQEWYLPGQAAVQDGGLHLTAQRRATTGSDGKHYPWTSGMVTTGRDSWNAAPRQTFTYGYFAAAVRFPSPAEGFFPAVWLIPAQTRSAPPELDIAEFPGTNSSVGMNLHWQTTDGNDAHTGSSWGPLSLAAGYHVVAADWEPDSVTWYIDGVQRYRITDPARVPQVPMELVLNLAVGYPSAPPAAVTAAQFDVDWVQVWQH